MHLFWDLDGRFAAAEVTLTVTEPPRVDRLYFWALQATFTDGTEDFGGAHLGLQWHPDHPGGTAANWGGYRSGGGELDGSRSELPSALGNPHTRDFAWQPHVPYRLRIERSPDRSGAWRGSVGNQRTGSVTVIRDLYPGGTHLRSLMVWSEVFARCEHPSVAVQWSDPVAVDDDGARHRPAAVTVNYQSLDDGGCSNTSSDAVTEGGTDGRDQDQDQGQGPGCGIVQRTAVPRTTPQGTRLGLP